MVLEAVFRDGRALAFADAPLRADKQVVSVALMQDSGAIDFVDDTLVLST